MVEVGVLSNNWIINYDGLIIDYKDVTEGIIDYSDGSRDYFIKLYDNNWLVISFSKNNMRNSYIIDQINLAHSKAGTNKVNAYFMELLYNAFPEKARQISNSEMRDKFEEQAKYLSSQIKYEADRFRYISDLGAVIINGQRYTEGQIVYFNQSKYIVKVDGNGEGYLDLAEYPQGKGFIVIPEQKFTREISHKIDYSQGKGVSQFPGFEAFIDYTNGIYDVLTTGTIITSSRGSERRIRAPRISNIEYWECVDFTPGSRSIVGKSGSPRVLEEGVLTSKGGTPSPPSGDYGDWLIKTGPADFEGDGKGQGSWKRLKDTHVFRYLTDDDYIWYRNIGNGFEEVVVSDFRSYGSNYQKVRKLFNKHGTYLSDAFFEDLKKEFPVRNLTFEQFVNKYKGKKWLKAPVNWSDDPHTPTGGTKTKLFGKFNVYSGTFKVDVRYNTFLKYAAGGDTISRGKAKLELIKYTGSGYEVVDTLFNVNYNVGNYWDRTTDKYVSKEYKGKGSYGFKLTLIDTFQDTQTIYVRAQPTITEYTTGASKEYDTNSSFTFYIIDPITGRRIPYEGQDAVVLKGSGEVFTKCFSVVVPKGQEVVIVGVVQKGNISTGGLLNEGAAARLRDGFIKYTVTERIPPIIVTSDESIGKIIDLPENGWVDPSEEEQEGEGGDKQNPFFWVDLITIEGYPERPIPDDIYDEMLKSATCYPKGVVILPSLLPYNYDGSPKDWSPQERREKERTFLDVNREVDGLFEEDIIEFTIKNPFDESIKIGLEFHVDDNYQECGGGGFISFSNVGWSYYGRGDLIGDGVEELPSFVRVAITELISNHEIIGGCPGCYAEVLIKDGDNVLKTIRIDEEGWTDFSLGNLYDYGLDEFDIEIKTYQKGYVDPRGYDVRCMFALDTFKMFTQYELAATNFDSMLEFYINDDLKLSLNEIGEGEHYFPVKKGLNKYKFVFKTNNWDYNWDYAEIDWIRLTNWICDDVPVVPYCEPGRGDKCIEALIGCLLGLLPKKKGCVIIKYIDYDTGEIIKQVRYGGYNRGEYTFHAPDIPDFEVVGDKSKTVFIEESEVCAEVEFYYRRLYRDCVWVIHRDINTGNVILKETYESLVPGEYTFTAKSFANFRVVGSTTKTITIHYLTKPPEECKLIVFDYEYIEEKDPYLDCVWVIYREKDNPNNVFAVDYHYNLSPGVYRYSAKEFEGYEIVGDKEKEIEIVEVTDPVIECKLVIFEYRKIKKGCVIVKFKDRVNDIILDTDYYYDLFPGEYTYHAKEFEGYKLVDSKIKTILVTEEDEECKEVVFLYEPLVEGCAIGKKIWLFT